MLDFFKKRSVAIGVFVLVVLVFSLIGSRLSLDRACRKAEAAFFDADLLDAKDYYTCPGDQLEHCVDYATRLLTVIGMDGVWSDAYEALVQARLGLMDALDAKNIPDAAAANQALAEAVAQVEAVRASGADLPASYDDFDEIVAGFEGAQAVLDAPAYNEHLLAFREDVLGAFPANILGRLLGVKAPETFP